jgi:amino acid transporter
LIEVVGGLLKLTFYAIIIVVLIFLNQTFIKQTKGLEVKSGTSYWNSTTITQYDRDAVKGWPQAFFISLSIAAFAFVGVEITAATALEARVAGGKTPTHSKTIGRTVKFSAVYISLLAGVAYVLAGGLVTLNIPWNHQDLPQMSWVKSSGNSTTSAIVLAAKMRGFEALAHTLNVFLMITALMSANTNLYVASRTLFSLTRSLDGGLGQPWYIRLLAYFGKTNSHKVPLRALVASCIFVWIPFITVREDHSYALETLALIGSTGVIIVWACECWAYIRFRSWYVSMSR